MTVAIGRSAHVMNWEGDLPTEHPNRCKLRDNLLYADIFNDDGSHRAAWRCHKREGHDGPCSSHNDCGVMNGGVVCGLLPRHSGPHAWETRITVTPASKSLVIALDDLKRVVRLAQDAAEAVHKDEGLVPFADCQHIECAALKRIQADIDKSEEQI